MPTSDVLARVEAWLHSLWSDPEAAASFASNPEASMAHAGVTNADLAQVNLHQAADHVSHTSGLSGVGQQALHHYADGGYAPSVGGHAPNPIQQIVYITKEVHSDNPAVTNIFNDNSVHIDQSQNVFNSGIIGGNVSVDGHDANAVGAGAVAGVDSNQNVANGDHSTVNTGTLNQADHGSQIIDGSNVGQNQVGSPGGVQVGHDASGGFNTGVNTGVTSGGSVDHTVVGDHNSTANIGGSADGSALSFGQGAASAASGNSVHDGSLAAGGSSQNLSHNTTGDGGAIAGHDASGTNVTDSHDHVNATFVEDSTNVDTTQDHSLGQSSQNLHDTHAAVDHSTLAGHDAGGGEDLTMHS
jgi:hypothetical protein